MRDVGLVDFALHVDLVYVAFGHDEGGSGAEHEDGADGVAHLNVAREDHAVHGRDDGGVAELFFKLLEAGLALRDLRVGLLQLGGVDADLRFGGIALGECGEVVRFASSRACLLTMPSLAIC